MQSSAERRREEEEEEEGEEEEEEKEGCIPLIPVVIWTWGLGGLRPAPFFAEICRQSEERMIDYSERNQRGYQCVTRVSVSTCML